MPRVRPVAHLAWVPSAWQPRRPQRLRGGPHERMGSARRRRVESVTKRFNTAVRGNARLQW